MRSKRKVLSPFILADDERTVLNIGYCGIGDEWFLSFVKAWNLFDMRIAKVKDVRVGIPSIHSAAENYDVWLFDVHDAVEEARLRWKNEGT